MILHLGEFDEGESRRRFHFETSIEEATSLCENTGYRAGPLSADLDVNLVGTTIRVVGRIDCVVRFECGRCLEKGERELSIDAEFVLMESSEWSAAYDDGTEERELNADDMNVSLYQGEDIDLAPLVREAILLELPTLPICSEGQREVCDSAYRQNVGKTTLDQLEEASLDQRWAALKNIKLKD